ncbi:MAG: BTAD domain-containing putative transcriptional regulator [Gemmatimonadales bacterium]
MHQFRMLGGIGLLDDDGVEINALLRQPKHVALLAYLVMPTPGTWHRRDSVLATLWPDFAQDRARAALRSALYTLRLHLPEGAIAARGADDLSVDPGKITTDVAGMAGDFAAGRYADALAIYRGDLLPGVFSPGGGEFDQWLEGRRRHCRSIAQKAAAQLAEALACQGDIPGATEVARRSMELDPDDEPAARRLITLLDRSGDRAQAFAVYERFRAHIGESFGTPPSPETIALLDAVRTRRTATTTSDRSPEPTHSPDVEPSAHTRIADTPSTDRTLAVEQPTFSMELPEPAVDAPFPKRRGRRGARWSAVQLVIAIALVAWAAFGGSSKTPDPPGPDLFIMPMANETGDPALAYIATGIAEGVTKRLADIGGLEIRSGARGTQGGLSESGIRDVARRFGSTTLLRSSLRRTGDTLELRAVVVDATTLAEQPLRVHRFSATDIRDAESRLAADVAGTVFRVAMPAVPRRSVREINPESYRLMLEGWHQLLANVEPTLPSQPTRRNIAGTLFQRAVNIDPLNARAWSGLSSAYAYQTATDEISFDEGYERATAAARHALALDSLESSAWGNLAYMRALKTGDLAVGLELIRKAIAAEPANPEVFMIKQGILASAHRYDEARDAARIARQLDPLGVTYLNHEASAELCVGQAERAVELYAAELAVNPSQRVARTGMTRALARAGRFDEAIASWHEQAAADRDGALLSALTDARGAAGYWSVRHAVARKRLTALARESGRVSPLKVVHLSFAAGDTAAVLVALERALATNTPALHRIACFADLDEYRGTPFLQRVIDRIGPIRVHQ